MSFSSVHYWEFVQTMWGVGSKRTLVLESFLTFQHEALLLLAQLRSQLSCIITISLANKTCAHFYLDFLRQCNGNNIAQKNFIRTYSNTTLKLNISLTVFIKFLYLNNFFKYLPKYPSLSFSCWWSFVKNLLNIFSM